MTPTTSAPETPSPAAPAAAAGKHWLVRPGTIRLLWVVGIASLIGATALDLTIPHPHANFGVDGLFGFYSAYGFLTCAAMVVGAKLLGFLLKKPEGWYRDRARREG